MFCIFHHEWERVVTDEVGDDVHGDGEDDSGVALVRDMTESLEISELESSGTLRDDVGGVLQSPAGLVFALSSDHFSSGLSGSLSLSSHGSLELLGDPDVLHLHPLHENAPGTGGSVQGQLHLHCNGVSETER